jgi:YVTN family beta-propeller protein
MLGVTSAAAQAGPASAARGAGAAARPVIAYVTGLVAGPGPGIVTPIQTATNKALPAVSVGPDPVAIAITPDGRTAYAVSDGPATGGSATVTPIQTATDTALAPIRTGVVGSSPEYIAITPDGKTAYVANIGCPCPHGAGVLPSVTAISTATNTVTKKFAYRDANFNGLVIDPNGRTAYLLPGMIPIKTATNTVLPPIQLPGGNEVVDADAMAFSPDGRTGYVGELNPGTVSVIRTATNTVTTTIKVGLGPLSIAVSPDGATAYVANLSDTVSVISTATNRVIKTIKVGRYPCCLTLTPDGKTAYLINQISRTVSVIRTATNTVAKTIQVKAGASGIAITPDGKTAYLMDDPSPTVTPISTALRREPASGARLVAQAGASFRGTAVGPCRYRTAALVGGYPSATNVP